MKTKNILGLIIALFIGLGCYAQLKVDQYGRIGMGTNWPNPEFKCHIKGNLLLTTHPAAPTYELRMKVGNGWPGVEIGSNKDIIAMWSSYVSFNKLYAEQYYKASDRKLKSNLQPISKSTDKIMKLNAYTYDIVDNGYDEKGNKVERTKKEFGFVAQEVEELFPEVKITGDAKGIKLMDYDQIIPILVASTQEQQQVISNLEAEVKDLKEKINALSSGSRSATGIETSGNTSKTMLFQNSPNPFNEKTEIRYSVEVDNFQSGSILIFDMNGVMLKSYPAFSGENTLTISGKELKAGMYIYSLIVNDTEFDTKRMILKK